MKGTYILFLELPESATVQSRSRSFVFEKGFYAYVGSAMNGLEARIARHLSPDKKRHWHVDFLLDRAITREVLSAESEMRIECLVAGRMSDLPAIKGFGCSDCRCGSHLFFSQDLEALKIRATEAFRISGLSPAVRCL